MDDLVVITPTRGRPAQFGELCAAVHTTTNGRVPVVGLADDDDPTLGIYLESKLWRVNVGPRRSLSGWTNHAALAMADSVGYLASLGDDHRPRTKDWDLRLIDAIEAMDGPGFAYGNDLFQGQVKPTAWVVSPEVVKAVGWMMPPGCEHMYVDDAVLHLGLSAGRIAYRPDVIIEHLHPYAGKAEMDESYRATNSAERFAADRVAFEAWYRDEMPADVAKVKALVREVAR